MNDYGNGSFKRRTGDRGASRGSGRESDRMDSPGYDRDWKSGQSSTSGYDSGGWKSGQGSTSDYGSGWKSGQGSTSDYGSGWNSGQSSSSDYDRDWKSGQGSTSDYDRDWKSGQGSPSDYDSGWNSGQGSTSGYDSGGWKPGQSSTSDYDSGRKAGQSSSSDYDSGRKPGQSSSSDYDSGWKSGQNSTSDYDREWTPGQDHTSDYDRDWKDDRYSTSDYNNDWEDDEIRGSDYKKGKKSGRRNESGTGRRNESGTGRSRDLGGGGTAGSAAKRGGGKKSTAGSARKRDLDRRSGSGSRGGGRGGKKPDLDITQILMYVIGALILIIVIAIAVKSCGLLSGKADSADVSSELSTESTAQAQTTVDGISIDGLSQAQAKDAVMKQYGWDMKVTYKDKEAPIKNLMEEKVDMLLEQIYAGDEKGAFTVDTSNMMDAAKGEAALLAGKWNMVPKSGGITAYDKKTGKFTFEEGSNGEVIDQDKLAQDIVDAIQRKDYKAVIPAQTKEVSPDLSIDQLKEKYKTISTFTTTTTDNSNRNENIRLSCDAINGTIVNPGQEFSFNNTTGARTEAKGYKPATAYLNGEIVQEPGGGVCQISSTLYNAVIFAGLKSTERHAHSYEPSYVTPGEDAAVSFGGPDFKFVNNSDYPIAIKTSFDKKKLTISIYGVPILEPGVKIRMSSKKMTTLDPPAPVYEEDQTLQLDEEQTVKEAVPGSSWSTDLVTYKDDKEVSREFFHNSSYRGKSAIIKRNTSGVVITTEASTEAPPSTEALLPSQEISSQAPESGPAGPGSGPASSQPAGGPVNPAGPPTNANQGVNPDSSGGPQNSQGGPGGGPGGAQGPGQQGPGH